jgi:hypothetical protein
MFCPRENDYGCPAGDGKTEKETIEWKDYYTKR